MCGYKRERERLTGENMDTALPLEHLKLTCIFSKECIPFTVCASSEQTTRLLAYCMFTYGSTRLHVKHKRVLLTIKSAVCVTGSPAVHSHLVW